MGAPLQAVKPPQNQTLRLRPGELLFAEGDKSSSMYLLKSGSIRLFIKKGDSNVELAVIKPGEILGELAFLDGNPRSVSGEALVDSELVEISVPLFKEVLQHTPEWLKALLKTIVARIRAANTRIRQLEAANSQTSYSDRAGGKKSSYYLYLSHSEFLRVAISFVSLASRPVKPGPQGVEVDPGEVQIYAGQVMGVATSKVSSAAEVLRSCGLLNIEAGSPSERWFVPSREAIDEVVPLLAEEERLEPAQRKDLSVKGLKVMECIIAHLAQYEAPDQRTGLVKVDLNALKRWEADTQGNDPFKDEDLGELFKLGYIADLKLKGVQESLAWIKPRDFVRYYRLFKISRALRGLNDQKRELSGVTK